MIAFKKNFSRRELLWFGPLFALFAGMVGGIVHWRFDAPQLAAWIGMIAGMVIVLHYLVPPLRRVIFMAWLGAVFPIGWLLSHALLGIVFYLVVFPIGLLLRLFRHDPLTRWLDQRVTSYWIARQPSSDPRKYFRQY